MTTTETTTTETKEPLKVGDKILVLARKADNALVVRPATVSRLGSGGFDYTREGGSGDWRSVHEEGRYWCRGQTGPDARKFRAHIAKQVREKKVAETKRKLEEAKRRRERDREAEERFVEILAVASRAIKRAKLPRELRAAALAAICSPHPFPMMMGPYLR